MNHINPPFTLSQISWEDIRTKRRFLLQETDWTVGNDSPLNEQQKRAYRIYRQKLRDITTTSSTPGEVVWPQPPQ